MIEQIAVEVADLAVRFRQRERTIHAVNGVSFRLARGEVLGILGESGSGKSVTLRALMRLLPANCEIDGRLTINGEDITEAPRARLEQLRGGSIAMIFQEPATALDPVFTIGEQIAETIRQAPARLLSARDVRGNAPARDDCACARLQSERAARRRADDGARRDGADPDPAAVARITARVRYGRNLCHA